MRRLILIAILTAAVLTAALSGCRRPQTVQVETAEEESEGLASMLHVADPRTSAQLLKGFYDVEQNAWRWTMSTFSVALRPPAGAAEKGANLMLKFTVPDPVIEQLKSVSVSATAGGAKLQPESYSKPGEYIYSRDVPASALTSDSVTVEFSLDKFLAPGAVDQRELGVVVTMVGFEAK